MGLVISLPVCVCVCACGCIDSLGQTGIVLSNIYLIRAKHEAAHWRSSASLHASCFIRAVIISG